ncbi:pre-rRNA processing protein [Microsporum canis]|uniref:Ribosomal RNA-processing protein 9 n=1 Tax=Arthroderma otae (strain ATCC MYA-4605 / CBS 113480) TaxID=554155 RepID=C5FXX7_ARTOC|nr:rRNA processing protein RRP9 [Microsporum canis CBS 113480]EEQ34375.1 ribosomal RNA-processing protein 9 [Microsporum canis CBS 113480]
MSSFFTLPASQRKRKREDRVGAPVAKKRGVTSKGAPQTGDKSRRQRDRDESISGSESEGDEGSEAVAGSDDESLSGSDEDETAAERRLILAEQYLHHVREEVDEVGFDAADIDRDLIAERLKEDVDESKGRAYRLVASTLSLSTASHSYFRADTNTTTAVALHYPFIYTVSKDRTLIKWELSTPLPTTSSLQNGEDSRPNRPLRKKPKKIRWARGLRPTRDGGEKQGHVSEILAVAVSPSGQFIATGGADNRLIIWDAQSLTPLKTFTHHRDSVSGLAFTQRISSSSSGEQLFSASFDRTIKTWSLSPDAHAYVETLFGHQDHVLGVASMITDQCVSVGSRDRTARLWKVIDETQLVFRAGGMSKTCQYSPNSTDCVAAMPPTHFVTGSDSGAISLWSIHKKKPLHTIYEAHGLDPLPPPEKLSSEADVNSQAAKTANVRQTPRWITALATVPGTDIVLSGSWDGWIRAWEVSEDKRRLRPLGCIGGKEVPKDLTLSNGTSHPPSDAMYADTDEDNRSHTSPPLRGIVNGISVYERRGIESTKPGHPSLSTMNNKKSSNAKSHGTDVKGLCIVAALGKEHRLGRWKVFDSNDSKNVGCDEVGGRNGAVVFEVPFSN